MKELLSDFRVRRLLLANITGSIGSGVTIIAVPWLLVQRPGGDRLYGYITIAITIAVFALIPHYGAWLDRHSRKLALLIGEGFGAITTLTMATWIALAGQAETWQFLVLYAGGMLYYTLHFPAKAAFVQQIFEKRHYKQLIGLMEIQGQTASMISGGAASMMLDRVPIYWILFADAATYIISFIVQSTIPYRATHLEKDIPKESTIASIKTGLRWLRARPKFTLFIICTMAPFVAVMTGNYLFPIYVQNILQAPAVVFGRGEIAFAVGAVLAGVLGPRLINRYSAPNVAMVMMGIFICGLIILGSLQSITAFYIALVLVGLGGAGSRVSRSTVLYTVVPNEIMGRVNVTLACVDRLLRTLLQFGAIYVVIKADAAWAFIGLVLFVGVALYGAFQARHALSSLDPSLDSEAPKS